MQLQIKTYVSATYQYCMDIIATDLRNNDRMGWDDISGENFEKFWKNVINKIKSILGSGIKA